MLADLFEEDDAGSGPAAAGPASGVRTVTDAPLPPRRSTRLAGIYNLGATCYLNALLQTLLMTPEFREALFLLSPDELGHIEDVDKPGAKIRIIPLQLQRLFARLLLLDSEGVNTTELTDSFGWTGSEAFQQHDAQELNRILFSAIEDSLVGTEGQCLIQQLYHGTVVNQIICEQCGNVVEREEDFLDLCVAVGGASSLESAMTESYGVEELLCGQNQYRCEICQRLRNARKGSKFRHLPPILTISLLRFSFDFQKMQRYKEIGKFAFPKELSLGKFCENETAARDAAYDLFSVVIHRGSTHGGHYHSYICDVDALGQWTHLDEEQIVIPTDPATGKVDYIELDTPGELLQAILSRSSEHVLMVDRLCSELTKQTGVSWNKRFKKLYGPINKFLKKHDDKFVYDPGSKWVSLKVDEGDYSNCDTTVKHHGKVNGGDYSDSDTTVKHHGKAEETKEELNGRTKRPPSPAPEPGCCWFNFDDAQVRPIRTQDLEKQFSGKESAYMLFYRKRSMTRPTEARGSPSYCVPDRLTEEVMEENIKLVQHRHDYEEAKNTIVIDVHFSLFYAFIDCALHPDADSCHFMELSIDRRKTLAELRTAIVELGGEIVMPEFVLHTAKTLPAGLHLYDRISGDESSSIQSLGVTANHTMLFVWNGDQIRGEPVATGNDCEPVALTVVSGNPTSVSDLRAYPRNLTVGGLRCILAEMTSVQPEKLELSRLVTRGERTERFKLYPGQDCQTLQDLNVADGDTFIIGDTTQDKDDTNGHDIQSQKLLSFTVENRCEASVDGVYPVVTVQVDKDATVEGLKLAVSVSQTTSPCEVDSRLRIDDSDRGLSAPLHEHQTLSAAGLKTGMRLMWELGQAPGTNQITLTFTPSDPTSDMHDLEVIVERHVTVEECMNLMIATASHEGDYWHLRGTNWCGEAADILDDLAVTLEQCQLKDGDHLLLERGKLPPKGFMKLPVWLHPTLSTQVESNGSSDSCSNGISEKTNGTDFQPRSLGEVIISKDATLSDLRQQIMNLPEMTQLVPTPLILRVRLVENGRLGTVLRLAAQTLQRLKVTSSCVLGIQILDYEENIDGNQIVLNLMERVPGSRTYRAPWDFVWNIGRGADPSSLRQSVADYLARPVQQIAIAKHFNGRHEWVVIKEGTTSQKNVRRPKPQKGKKKGHSKVNLKLAPFHIIDGDDIGVKDLQFDPLNTDDFGTEEDDAAKVKQRTEAEEKEKRKAEEKSASRTAIVDVGGSGDRQRKTEVGIKIHVANFR